MLKEKNKLIYICLVLFLFLIPWLNSNADSIENIPKISQETNPFFEINPCKVSLVEFLSSNHESIFQDHFYFRPDNKSSIKCFGTITGVTVLQKNFETQFFISIGTNSLINILLQGIFWLFLFSLFPKNVNTEINRKLISIENLGIILISYFSTFSIYSQKRFYEDSFYIFDLNKNNSYLLLFLLFTFLFKNLINLYEARSQSLINFLPLLVLFTSIFSGLNTNLFSSLFVYVAIKELLNKESKINKHLFRFYVFLSFWWLINSNGSFYFKPGKLRGFTNSVYEFNSNFYWIVYFALVLYGIWLFVYQNRSEFNYQKFLDSYSISSFIILILGLIASNFPILNFLSYYYLGLQRNVVEITNPFSFDQFSVKISWRGIFPSSETIGEFYALLLLLILFKLLRNSELSKIDILGILSSSIGLYFSDNRTSIVLVFLSIFLCFYFKYFAYLVKNTYLKYGIIFVPLLLLLPIIGSNNLNLYLEFMSGAMIRKAQSFQFDTIYSSYLSYLNDAYENNKLISKFFSFLSVLAYLLNRSEIWGLFFARFNPTYMELLFGSGPLNFGQLYGETVVNDSTTFLLPHSSILSFLVFFGVIPLALVLIYLFKNIYKNKNNYEFLLINFFILINILKNDSMNYFSIFTLYISIYILFNSKERLTSSFFIEEPNSR